MNVEIISPTSGLKMPMNYMHYELMNMRIIARGYVKFIWSLWNSGYGRINKQNKSVLHWSTASLLLV